MFVCCALPLPLVPFLLLAVTHLAARSGAGGRKQLQQLRRSPPKQVWPAHTLCKQVWHAGVSVTVTLMSVTMDTAPTAAAAAARAITATAAAAARALTTTTPTAAAAAKGMMVAGRTALAAVLLGSASWISPCPAAAVGRVGRVPWCVGRTRVTCLTCPEDGSRRFWG